MPWSRPIRVEHRRGSGALKSFDQRYNFDYDELSSLLERLPRKGALVSPGAVRGSPLSDMSLTGVVRRMG